jgi:peptidoglycan hydrolase CwlO-like protein
VQRLGAEIAEKKEENEKINREIGGKESEIKGLKMRIS